MDILTVGVFILCFISGCSCDVNNIVKGKILFSNQNLVENNEELIHASKKTILSREEIYKFLASAVPSELMTQEKMKELFEYLSPTELRHMDFLIYLMGYYAFAREHLLKVLVEILLEDERIFEKLLQSLGVNQAQLPSLS